MSNRIGYARSALQSQSIDVQINALRKAGCTEVFSDNGTSGTFPWPELKKALEAVQAGDTFVVVNTNRISRDIGVGMQTLIALKARGVHVKSLDHADVNIDTDMVVAGMLAVRSKLAEMAAEDEDA